MLTPGSDGLMVCPNCYNSDFRLSKFRSEDLLHLLLLKYPVRCRTCKERIYANAVQTLNLALKHRKTSPPEPRKAGPQ